VLLFPYSIQMHNPVSLSLRIASPFMPHSYAPHPMTHPFDCDSPLCSPYTIGPPSALCDCHVTLASLYIDKVHSLYSLVLISQDFLFSCLHLCELAVGIISTSLVPSTLSSAISHCQDLATGLAGHLQAFALPPDPKPATGYCE
jgi:hypothetical protein